MRCKKSEKQIYLYGELTTLERQHLQRHLDRCDRCMQLFLQTNAERAWLRDVRPSTEVTAADPALKRRIMAAIGNIGKQPSFSWGDWPRFLDAPSARYAFAGMATILVIFFAAELNRIKMPAEYTTPAAPAARVNSTALFHEIKRTLGKKRTAHLDGLYACLRACESSDDSACADCKTKYLNK